MKQFTKPCTEKEMKQFNKKIITIVKEIYFLIINMVIIYGLFISSTYAYITLGKIDNASIWFLGSFISLIYVSYSMINNLSKNKYLK